MPRDELIDLIYEAALDPDRWEAVLQRLAGDMGCSQIYLHNETPLGTETQGGLEHNSPTEYGQHWRATYNESRPDHTQRLQDRMRGAMDGPRAGSRYLLQPREDFFKSEAWHEFYRHYNQREQAYLVFHVDRRAPAQLVMYREQSPFEKEDLRFLESLGPHLGRAMLVNRRAVRSNQEAEAAVESVPSGTAVLDSRGDILLTNAALEHLAELDDGLSISRNQLVLSHPPAAAEFRRLIGTASETDGGGWLAAPRPSGKRAFAIAVSPVRSAATNALADRRAAVVVLVSDPEERVLMPLEAAQQIWRLTPTEARLASLLAMGVRLDDAAVKLRIGMSTARTHLKRIFFKTETKRQAELVALIWRTTARGRRTERT